MTHISSTYEPQDATYSSVENEPEQRAMRKSKRESSLFAFFQSAAWQPLCPDLMREISVGLGRQD